MNANDAGEETALRAHFAQLRAADRARVPSFDALLRERPVRTRTAWAGAALATVGALAALAAWRLATPPPTPALPEVMFTVAAEMPSDFLLEPAAVDVRREAPTIAVDANDEVPFL